MSETPGADTLELERRITEYLTGGGLFNPEMADHEAVRDLLLDCRAGFKEQRAREASLRAEKEELRRERDAKDALWRETAEQAATNFDAWLEDIARAEAAESLLAEAGKALEPFAKSFDGRRDAHSRRHADRDLGYARFDKMPDEWPIEPAVFSMGAYRRARSVATRIASLTAKEPDNDPVDSDTCIDCMGDGRYPSGATCKSCRGSGHVIAGDGISPKVPR